jgi:signal transduction histidine kinase
VQKSVYKKHTKIDTPNQTSVISERLAATGKMASEVAHELNTPLGGILIYSHLLLEDIPEDHPHRENIIKIIKLANRCKIIVKGLLDFAHQETLSLTKTLVNRVLESTVHFMERHVLLKNIKIIHELDPNLPEISADENKLEQLFVNFIINAGEAMNNLGTLVLRTRPDPDRNGVLIQFSDTGCGIPSKHLSRIFEPFFTTKERGKGTGLGLSISHGIIKLHGGDIKVESVEGKGTTFTIFLPRSQEKRDEDSWKPESTY